MVKSCYSCYSGEYHTEMRGGPPGGGAPEPAWFRCQAGHGTFDAFYVDQGIADDSFHCEDWTPDPPCSITTRCTQSAAQSQAEAGR